MVDQLKKKLLSEKRKLLRQVSALEKDDPYGNADCSNDKAAIDSGVRDEINHETIVAEIKDINDRLEEIDEALKRIEKGKYGYCRRCKKRISPKRLALVPETLYCVRCEEELKG